MKNKLGWDDALDVWAVHGVGGILGVVMTGVFATTAINPSGANGLIYGGYSFFMKETAAAVGAGVYAFVVSYVLLFLINKVFTVRVSSTDEENVDEAFHGETAYF